MKRRIVLSAALRAEYRFLFTTCVIRRERESEVERIVDRIASNRSRYESVARKTGVPWGIIAVVHQMEAGLRFDRHLHNGDPLTARTVRVPSGRPREGLPPFTWEESATDALRWVGWTRRRDWSLPATLFALEGYNGWGYRLHHPNVKSPYLWAFSNHYTRGKYVADGRWAETAVSQQAGAATLLRRMAERGLVGWEKMGEEIPFLRYSDAGPVLHARALQAFLNRLPGIHLKTDGWPGPRTSEAFKRATGYYLLGDPRANT